MKTREEIIFNLRRIWYELRRQFGENDILINDFRYQTKEIFNNYGFQVDEIIINSVFYR